MRRFPPLPDLDDADPPDGLLEGHLWLLELIDGTGLRFRMDESGLLRFGGPEAVYDDLDAVPPAVRPAVRHARDRFDREALRRAVADPAGVTFFGVATHRCGTDYDWDRIPPFLGTDVWTGADGEREGNGESGGDRERGGNGESGGDREREGNGESQEDGAFRPPDAAAAIFEGVGLAPVNAVAREVNARDFDPEGYAVPASEWRDGPAAGVVVRNKRGGRVKISRGPSDDGDGAGDGRARGDRATDPPDPDELAAVHAGRERFDRVVAALERRGEPATVDRLADLTVEAVARETPLRFGDGESGPAGVDVARFRASVVERASAFLDER
ncbi:hypothetical protein DJ73_16180 [Halorubrum sp. Ea1]|uniref:hypothetical protein n=1 Tax=Halorubrum sp. Ea1 TaxID=1480718 RepID=UPI000B99B1D3|nr:hypothetical protein [Halorubrum sp. Ea1]OYR50366.1 hypothetical protein DJ73_16180 [Halorubrum sp. Ea1]